MNNEVAYRDARPDDISFIFDSWLRSWRNSPWAGIIPNNLYFALTRNVIEQLVARGAKLEVACLAADPDRILGWCCSEQTGEDAVIHYCYTKDPYLNLGINESLVARASGKKPGFYTFRYRQVVDACQPQGKDGWHHTPEIARRK